jgi:hypothetical protein
LNPFGAIAGASTWSPIADLEEKLWEVGVAPRQDKAFDYLVFSFSTHLLEDLLEEIPEVLLRHVDGR